MAEQTFSKLIRKSFNDNAQDAQRLRIDGRTVGYASVLDPQKIEWMGMTPAPGDNLWYVVTVEEEPNKYLTHIDENARFVNFLEFKGKDEGEKPLSFEKAVEYLAVWELRKMQGGFSPVLAQRREDLGRRHYKDIAMRRGFVVTTTGTMAAIDGFIPDQTGKILKEDLEALEKYRDRLTGENILDELLTTHDPLYVDNGTVVEDIENFAQIAAFDKMQIAAKVLTEYARVKHAYIAEFYGNPARVNQEGLVERLNAHGYFNPQSIEVLNRLRTDYAGGIFRYFHVAEADWDKELDFHSRELRVELLKNPDAKRTHDYLDHQIAMPFADDSVDTMLFVAARALVYFRDMMEDSRQLHILERRNIYKSTDINDLLNFLDLLEIKFQSVKLAEQSFALPGTNAWKKMKYQRDDFEMRVRNLKDNLREAADFSPAQERQIDDFIKTGTPVYLLDRIMGLPAKLGAAHGFVSHAVMPHPHQLSLDLDFNGCAKKRIEAPTRNSRPSASPKP